MVKSMPSNEFFSVWDYREGLNLALQELHKIPGSKYSVQNMADHCGVHRSYLSKVLHLKAHLNFDQLYLAAQFTELDAEKTDFLESLLLYQRCEVFARREKLKASIERVKSEHSHFDTKTSIATGAPLENEAVYFLHPFCQVVHMMLTIPKYRQDFELVLKTLSLSKNQLQEIIRILRDLHLIAVESSEVKILEEVVALRHDSPVIESYHALARNRAWSTLLRLPESKKNKYSLMFTANTKSYEEIKKCYLRLLHDIKKIVVDDTRATHLYEFHCDLFQWD